MFVYKSRGPEPKGAPVENTCGRRDVDRTLGPRAADSALMAVEGALSRPRLGGPGSTFSNQMRLRHTRSGRTRRTYYNARGVFPRLDDGRLIRGRRAGGGNKNHGGQNPPDWRRVPRRRGGSSEIAEG